MASALHSDTPWPAGLASTTRKVPCTKMAKPAPPSPFADTDPSVHRWMSAGGRVARVRVAARRRAAGSAMFIHAWVELSSNPVTQSQTWKFNPSTRAVHTERFHCRLHVGHVVNPDKFVIGKPCLYENAPPYRKVQTLSSNFLNTLLQKRSSYNCAQSQWCEYHSVVATLVKHFILSASSSCCCFNWKNWMRSSRCSHSSWSCWSVTRQ